MTSATGKTKTTLKIEYATLSWDYEFPDGVEFVLENDFIEHPEYYDQYSMKRVATLLLIDPNPSIDILLKHAHKAFS